ncbi:MAG: uracil-DNA glycosylase family protein, partial [Elusimicrobiota bacterium]
MHPVEITRQLAQDVKRLAFKPPAAYVYNPLEYAWKPHELYLTRYGAGRKEVLWLGMNPGPWGMAQTGIPFGEVNLARDWLGLEAPVGKPAREHPKRPVLGFATTRSEVSGARLWGWARDTFKTPERFFARHLILNFCPLSFVEESGRNLTPDKLPPGERQPLMAACDTALRRLVEYYRPKFVVGIGGFARKRAEKVLGDM